MERKILKRLNCREYEHPLDRKTLETVRNTKGFNTLLKKVNEYSIEKILMVQHTGSNFQVTDTNLSSIFKLFEEACNILNMPKRPNLYVKMNPMINAFAVGVDNPIVVLTSGALDNLTKDELIYIMGHELGHIKSGHTTYTQLALVLPILGQIVGNLTLGLGEIISQGVYFALLHWQRMAEYTCDRAGLLCVQDQEVAISALAKMAGLPISYYKDFKPDAFLEQARSFEGLNNDDYSKIVKFISLADDTHPWTVMRARELDLWQDEFLRIIKLHTECDPNNIEIPCHNCKAKLEPDDLFCPDCGTKVY